MSFIWNILSTKFCRVNLLILLALFSFSVSEMELTKWRGKAHSMSYKSLENLLSFHFNIGYISEIIIRVKCLQIFISQSISFFTFKMGIKGTFPVWFLGSWCLCWHSCDRRWEPPLLQLSGQVFPQATTLLCSLHKEQCPVVFIPAGIKAVSYWSGEGCGVLSGVQSAHMFYHERIFAGRTSGQQGGKKPLPLKENTFLGFQCSLLYAVSWFFKTAQYSWQRTEWAIGNV